MITSPLASGQEKKPKRPPNFVIIFADDLGYGDLGCFGAKGSRRRTSTAWPSEGMRFTDLLRRRRPSAPRRARRCSPAAIPTASASSVPSGRPAKIGIADSETHHRRDAQDARLRHGRSIGKWHLGHHPQFLPTRHGFDDYFGLPYSNDMWPKHPTAKFPDLPLIEGEKTIATQSRSNEADDLVHRAGRQFIEKNKDRPFFLYVPHTMPHVPLFVSEQVQGQIRSRACTAT